MALDRIVDDALVRAAKSAALDPGIGRFPLEIATEEQHSTYGRYANEDIESGARMRARCSTG